VDGAETAEAAAHDDHAVLAGAALDGGYVFAMSGGHHTNSYRN
jgi:hypothetical protein